METNLWNIRNLPLPPINTYKTPNNDIDIKQFYNVCQEARNFFEDNKYMHADYLVLSRIVYRMKMKFRSAKDFKSVEKINKALEIYFETSLSSSLTSIMGLIPSRYKEETYLPTKSLVDYVLVRLQGLVKLMERIVETCKIAAYLLHKRINTGHFWRIAFILFSLLSRIYILAKYTAKSMCEFYGKLLPFSSKLRNANRDWLPKNYVLPKDLKEWLNVSWLDSDDEIQIVEVPSNMSDIIKIFDLVEDDDDVEFCNEYVMIDEDDDDVEIVNEFKNLEKIELDSKLNENLRELRGFQLDEDIGEIIEINDSITKENELRDGGDDVLLSDASINGMKSVNSDVFVSTKNIFGDNINTTDESIIELSDTSVMELPSESIKTKKLWLKRKNKRGALKTTTKLKSKLSCTLEKEISVMEHNNEINNDIVVQNNNKSIKSKRKRKEMVKNKIKDKKGEVLKINKSATEDDHYANNDIVIRKNKLNTCLSKSNSNDGTFSRKRSTKNVKFRKTISDSAETLTNQQLTTNNEISKKRKLLKKKSKKKVGNFELDKEQNSNKKENTMDYKSSNHLTNKKMKSKKILNENNRTLQLTENSKNKKNKIVCNSTNVKENGQPEGITLIKASNKKEPANSDHNGNFKSLSTKNKKMKLVKGVDISLTNNAITKVKNNNKKKLKKKMKKFKTALQETGKTKLSDQIRNQTDGMPLSNALQKIRIADNNDNLKQSYKKIKKKVKKHLKETNTKLPNVASNISKSNISSMHFSGQQNISEIDKALLKKLNKAKKKVKRLQKLVQNVSEKNKKLKKTSFKHTKVHK